ncbi:MAG TPA: hypothetical protein VHR47_00760, partial [Bacillota bacterium]|nr:hypothetical protein [Bacillota bacterium]
RFRIGDVAMFRLVLRLFIGFAIPLVFGSLCLALSGAFGGVGYGIKNYLWILIVATVLMGFQSALFSLIMEWIAMFLKKRDASLGLLVPSSTILGGLAGSTLSFIQIGFIFIGLTAGLIAGLILWGLHHQAGGRSESPASLRGKRLLLTGITGMAVLPFIGVVIFVALKCPF